MAAVTWLQVFSGILVLASGLLAVLLLGREARNANQANRGKTLFLARISHEIRTPMNAIVGISELLLRLSDNMPAQAHTYARNIKQAAANLLSIINDILDLSKIESGKFEIVESSYRLSLLVNDLVNLVNVRLMEKPVRFVVSVAARTPDRLQGDATRVRQVLLNLLSNAIKYTNSGTISLSLDAARTRKGEMALRAEVRDTGIGIKPGDVQNLFGEYVQLDYKSHRNIQGTGLGLAIVKHLCQLMGGGIRVSSQFGQGSVFTVELPQKVEDEAPMAAVVDAAAKRVLVYERRNVIAASIDSALKDLGVPFLMVDGRDSFMRALGEGGFSHAILPVSLHSLLKAEMAAKSFGARVAVTAEDVHPFGLEDVRCLFLPLYSRPLAEFLNDAESETDAAQSSLALVRFTAPGATALVVDDLQTNLMVMKGLLQPYLMRVVTCSGGLEAVELVRRNEFDIVFMDHMMDDMDGLEATRAIRDLEGQRFKDLPIVAMTANALAGMDEFFASSGMSDFLPKPIDTARLNSILLRWLPGDRLAKAGHPAAKDPSARARHGFPPLRGIDTSLGLSRSGESLPAYLRTMRFFLSDVKDLPGAVRSAWHRDDGKALAALAHALKGSCGAIGAGPLADRALSIESAVVSGDLGFVAENVENLLRELNEAIEDLSAFVGQAESEGGEGDGQASPELIGQELAVLRKAFAETDAGGIDRAISRIRGRPIPQWLRLSLDEVWGHFQEVEYEEAIEQIDRLLEGDLLAGGHGPRPQDRLAN
ncbi:MAG: response regulator [Deltaproteobacteria bacterium]|nr:response regulator [Deltaproteobacteria bacterium]